MDDMIGLGLDAPRERSFSKALEQFRGRTLLLYGAGGFGVEMLHYLRKAGLPVAAFLDQNAAAIRKREELPVYKAEEAPFPMAASVVLFCIVMDLKRRQEVLSWLRQLGYPLILEGQALRALLVQPDDRADESLAAYYQNRRDRIEAARTLFCDSTSRLLYDQTVYAHATGDYSNCRPLERPMEEQYFPTDVPLSKGYRRFVDCGGYIGDTVESLIRHTDSIEACAVFEPDCRNFTVMTETLARLGGHIGQRFLFPCAVGGGAKMRRFSGGTGSGALSASGESMVQTVSLDMAVPDFHPTMIKMDIEGAELSALRGARKLIQFDRPDLAVCTYHAVNHIWDIPLLLDSWDLGYQFFLRTYNAYTMETVLYASMQKGDL